MLPAWVILKEKAREVQYSEENTGGMEPPTDVSKNFKGNEYNQTILLPFAQEDNFCRKIVVFLLRGMFEMYCLLSSSSISTWGTIKTNTYLYRAIQYLHNGV